MLAGLLLGAFVLGALGVSLLVVPLWREDRERMDARVNELLTLLEAKAAPAEAAAYIHQPASAPATEYLVSEDGLISIEIDD